MKKAKFLHAFNFEDDFQSKTVVMVARLLFSVRACDCVPEKETRSMDNHRTGRGQDNPIFVL